MLKITKLRTLQRAAAFELENDTCYNAPTPFQVSLNGEDRGVFTHNVFTLCGLSPDMCYELRVRDGSGESAACVFVTPPETLRLDATRFGAVGDGKTDCTSALQAAIAACPAGGTVYLPKGTYLTYPIFLHTGVLLYLERGAVLLGGTERARYPVLPGTTQGENGAETCLGTWEGNPLDCYAALVTAINAKNIAVAGEGVLDGNAQHADWWQNPKKKRGAWRPRTVYCSRCEGVALMGVTVQNSPSWTVHPCYCTGVDALDITISNPPDAPNTDGFDPESCEDVRILGVRISVGDDCIAIKSGKYYMSLAHPRACKNITVRNCLLARGHGAVVVGSEVSAGVCGVHVERCLMRSTDRGLRIKTRRGRGTASVLTDISCVRCLMEDVKTPFVINMYYFCDPDGHSTYVRSKELCPVDERTPTVGTLFCRDLSCTGCEYAGVYCYGLPESPIQSVVLENVAFTFRDNPQPGSPAMLDDVPEVAGVGLVAVNLDTLRLQNVTFTKQIGETLRCRNVAHFINNTDGEA